MPTLAAAPNPPDPLANLQATLVTTAVPRYALAGSGTTTVTYNYSDTNALISPTPSPDGGPFPVR